VQGKLYVGLSAQLALNRRLETLAQNMANVSTAGYRAEEISFSSLISRTAPEPVSFVSKGESYISSRPGGIKETGNPLDVAVTGDAWLAFESPRGTVLTRDGRLRMSPTGELETINGFRVLDVGGSPIQMDPNGGPPTIARDGVLVQNGRRVGALGLFTTEPSAKLTRFENSGVIPDKPANPQLDANAAGLLQGYIEGSNVDPVMEVTRLIAVQRTFEAVTAAMNEVESSLSEAIRGLAGG
jgi:flagellar basal-body rod protein FlgF